MTSKQYKCPFNYVGSKSKILNIIAPIVNKYPSHTLIDLFAGGFSVGVNSVHKKVIYNDINNDLKKLIERLYNTSIEKFIDDIEFLIEKYSLSKENTEAYYKVREEFNNSSDTYLFALLVFFSFNHQIRYNKKGNFNTPFGKNRSSYNAKTKQKLMTFDRLMQNKNISFHSKHFKNFDIHEYDDTIFYVDPPYLITTGSYNDGSRGVSSWDKNEERELYDFLDKIHKNNGKFVLSNMISKGSLVNDILHDWLQNYHTKTIKVDYRNYQRKKVKCAEVIVANFEF